MFRWLFTADSSTFKSETGKVKAYFLGPIRHMA